MVAPEESPALIDGEREGGELGATRHPRHRAVCRSFAKGRLHTRGHQALPPVPKPQRPVLACRDTNTCEFWFNFIFFLCSFVVYAVVFFFFLKELLV